MAPPSGSSQPDFAIPGCAIRAGGHVDQASSSVRIVRQFCREGRDREECMKRRNSARLTGALAGAALLAAPAFAQNDKPLKIGVLTDLTSVYSDIGGKGNIEAAKMAIEDFGGQMFSKPIEIVSSDVQMKADVAASIAPQVVGIGKRRRDHRHADVGDSARGDGIVEAVRETAHHHRCGFVRHHRQILLSYTAHWTYDTYSNAQTVGQAVVKRAAIPGISSRSTTPSAIRSRRTCRAS